MAKNRMHNTSEKKGRKKSIKDMTKDLSFTIKVDPLNCRKFTTSEIGRGCGIVKSKKGKGAYTRKAKHQSLDFSG